MSSCTGIGAAAQGNLRRGVPLRRGGESLCAEGPVLDTSLLLLGVIFSSIGLGFFLYGKKQQRAVPLVCGLALMLLPYFVGNAWALLAISLVLMAMPYFWRL